MILGVFEQGGNERIGTGHGFYLGYACSWHLDVNTNPCNRAEYITEEGRDFGFFLYYLYLKFHLGIGILKNL